MAFHPKDASRACIRRSRRLLQLTQENLPDSRVKGDLRRAALVTAVSGLDAYLHWLVYRRLSDVRNEGDLPKSLVKLDLPFTDLATLADTTLKGRASGVATRPWVQVKGFVQRRLRKEAFQSYEQVANALSWAGIKRPWKRVSDKLGDTPEEVKNRLNRLVDRRNQIVHEGDIVRALRPRGLRYVPITTAFVQKEVDWIEALIKKLEEVVLEGSEANDE